MWFSYRQNNSGGSFDVDKNVAKNVYIEANSADEANSRAELCGLYWDGVYDEIDCECCGDRWYPLSSEHGDKGADEPPLPYRWDTDPPVVWGWSSAPLTTAEGCTHEAVAHFKDGTRKYGVLLPATSPV